MNKLRFVLAACMSLMLLFMITVPGFASSADPATGTPKVEINLGADNAGAEFYFKTDVGIMPGTLKADKNGTLTVELGGSSRYVLTYAGAASSMPVTSDPEEKETTEPASEQETTEAPVTEEAAPEGTKKPPVKDLVIFIAGLVICGGFLLGSKIRSVMKSKKADKKDESDRDDYIQY